MIKKTVLLSHLQIGASLCVAWSSLTSALGQESVRRAEPVRRAESVRGTEAGAFLEPFDPALMPDKVHPPAVVPIPVVDAPPPNPTLKNSSVPQTAPLTSPTSPVVPQRTAPLLGPDSLEPTAPIFQGESPGDIRIGPSTSPGLSAEQMLHESASALLNKHEYANALAFYNRLLREFPTTRHRQEALYQMGVCLVQTKQTGAAMKFFKTLLDEFTDGPFVGPAAYRLAELYFAAGNYSDALSNYRLAADLLKMPELALTARFYQARCAQEIGRSADARTLFSQVASAPEPNIFREASLLSLARLAVARGDKEEAYKSYASAAAIAKDPNLRADAALQAGLLAIDLGKIAEARKFFSSAMQADPKGTFGESAKLAEMRALDAQRKYADVISTYNSGGGFTNPEIAPEAMLLVGRAMRKSGKIPSSLSVFDELLRQYPTSPLSEDASFERLAALYDAKSNSLLDEIESFLQAYPLSRRASLARFIKAEYLFNSERYGEAAAIYSALLTSDLSPEHKAQTAYRLAFSQFYAGAYAEAVRSFTYFTQKFPDHSLVPAALSQRGVAHAKLGDSKSALADFDTVISRFPDAAEREVVMVRKAQLFGEKGDEEAMAQAFRDFLNAYPESRESARANYWIGQTLFNNKDYQGAIPHLQEARKRDAESYNGRATLRIILSYYYLQQAEALLAEIEAYKPGKNDPLVPADVIRWLGMTLADLNRHKEAERYLAAVAEQAGDAPDEAWYYLAKVRNALSKWSPAADAANRVLKNATDPASRSRALLERARAEIGADKFDTALATISEIIELSPEGPLYAEALLLHGDLLLAKNEPADAAKNYTRVALLFEEPKIKTRALLKSSEAFRKSGQITEAEEALNRLRTQFPEFQIPQN